MMKAKLLLFTVLLLSVTMLSCSDNDDNPNSGNAVVENAFAAKYPGATRIDWEVQGAYYVVDFWQNNQERKAWFGQAGEWRYTETDLLYDGLPNAVKTALEQGIYAAWRICDIAMVERNGIEAVYVLEVEQGEKEYDLYYSADGVLVKAISDTGSNSYLPVSLPANAGSYIATGYPNARIVEVDVKKNGGYEVDIINNGKHLELLFAATGSWMQTKTEDLLQSEVPLNVLTAAQHAYSGYRIDDISYYETPTGSYYLLELELASIEVSVKVTLDGTVTEVSRNKG